MIALILWVAAVIAAGLAFGPAAGLGAAGVALLAWWLADWQPLGRGRARRIRRRMRGWPS